MTYLPPIELDIWRKIAVFVSACGDLREGPEIYRCARLSGLRSLLCYLMGINRGLHVI